MSFLNKTKGFVSPDYLFYKKRKKKQRLEGLETDISETWYTVKVAWPVGCT